MKASARQKKVSFPGGLPIPDNKHLSKDVPISAARISSRLTVPMLQNIGSQCFPAVKVGDVVKKGQVIGTVQGFVSAPAHAPVSGRVSEICDIMHPSGRMVPGVIIENDFNDTWVDLAETTDYTVLSSEDLRNKIQSAGIVGMGGAAFPTHVKLAPPEGKTIDTVIINGVECESYLTADHRLMLEKPEEIIEGTRMLLKTLGVSKGYIGIEANKTDAVESMTTALGNDPALSVSVLKVKYPQGAEKMLIKAILNRDVPPGGLPMDIGVVVQNVATAAAVFHAVRFGRPLIERVVSVTGEGIARPKNLFTAIGTPISDLVEQCGGFTAKKVFVIHGGPLMGTALTSTDVPVVKGTTGIVVLPAGSLKDDPVLGPCLRCGRCAAICPMGLNPATLGTRAEQGRINELKESGIEYCFECGLCAFTCPSQRPVTQLIREAKVRLRSLEQTQQKK